MSFRKATSVAAAATAAAATLSLLLSLTGTSTSTITITITGSGTHRQTPAAVPAIPSDDGTGSLSPQRRRRPQRQRQRQRQTPHQRRRRRTDENVENSTQGVMDDDDVVVDDDGALSSSSSSSLFADDGDFNGDANSTADDDDEWYLPEHEVTQPVLRGFGAGSANDWGLVLSMIGGSGGNTTDDDVEANGSDLFFDGSSASDVLFSSAVPLVSLSPEFLFDSADGDGGNGEEGAEAEAAEEMEQSDSLYRMSAGNVHSAVLTLQGKVYTAGSWGVEEDRGMGRSLDEGDYDLSDYSFSWGVSDGGGDDDDDDNDDGLNNGVNDDVVTQDDDLTDDNVTYVPNNDTETDIEIDDEFDNATMTITSTTTTAATRPSRPTTTTSTTTTTAASSSSSSPSSIEIAPTIYSFRPITELYAYSPSSDSHVLQTLPSDLPKFTQIQTSQYFTFLLDDRGRVYATGINTHGQLCLNDTDSRDRFYEVPPSFLFEDPSSGDNGRIVDVALGERHTLLLRDDGKVLACGWNAYGQLGIGTVDLAVVKPVLVVIDAPDLQNEDGQNETSQQDATENNDDDRDTNDDIVLDTNATNATAPETAATNTTNVQESQTNLTATDSTSPPTASLTPSPTLPPIPIDTTAIVGITAGRGSSYFLTRSGHVFSAGTNYEGQLCLGHRDDRTLPSLVDTIAYSPSIHSPNGTSVRSIAAGRSSFYVRMEDGSVYSCGSNAHGQLGIGAFDLDSVDVPRPVLLEQYDNDVDNSATSTNFTNSTNDHDDPRQPLVDVTRVFSGPLAYNAFFLSANGTIYAVGYNGAGQLGVGDETNRHAAAVVACSNGVLEKDEMAIWTEDAIEQRTFVSTGNDHVLFLGREEWFLGCRGGIVVGGDDDGGIFFPPNEEEGGANDTEPVSTAAPTASAAPSTSFVPSSAPSVSLAPTVSPMPSSVPSASLMPTLTPRPTEEEESIVPTFGPTPGYGSYPPTLSLEDAVGFPDDGSGSGSAGGGSDRGVVSGVSRMGGGLCGCHFGVSLVFLGMMTFWR